MDTRGRMRGSRRALLVLAVVLCVSAFSTALAAAQEQGGFAGEWRDHTADIVSLKLLISPPNGAGVYQVTMFIESIGETCKRHAHGSGTASGELLTGTWDVRCGDELRAKDAPFVFLNPVGAPDSLVWSDVIFARVR